MLNVGYTPPSVREHGTLFKANLKRERKESVMLFIANICYEDP